MSVAVESNYYALCICVLTARVPEEAFRIMDVTEGPIKFNDNDVEDILMFKKTHTWKQVGERYGRSADAIRRRVIRFQERQGRKGGISSETRQKAHSGAKNQDSSSKTQSRKLASQQRLSRVF